RGALRARPAVEPGARSARGGGEQVEVGAAGAAGVVGQADAASRLFARDGRAGDRGVAAPERLPAPIDDGQLASIVHVVDAAGGAERQRRADLLSTRVGGGGVAALRDGQRRAVLGGQIAATDHAGVAAGAAGSAAAAGAGRPGDVRAVALAAAVDGDADIVAGGRAGAVEARPDQRLAAGLIVALLQRLQRRRVGDEGPAGPARPQRGIDLLRAGRRRADVAVLRRAERALILILQRAAQRLQLAARSGHT